MIIVGTAKAPPYVPPPPILQRVPRRPRLGASWTSWTGEQWHLTESWSSVYALQGATGLGMTDPQHRWSEAPTVDGAAWDGFRTGPGEIFLPVRIGLPSMDHLEFLDVHDSFMNSLRPDRTSTYRITRPDGTWRQIKCRYKSGADAPVELDPVMARKATYGLVFDTDDPFWKGEPISPVFSASNIIPARYPMRYPYRLRSVESIGFASVINPGDADAYPLWRINGPFTAFTIGIGVDIVSVTLTKTVGQWVEIDMNPTKLTIVDEEGVDRWDAATAASFANIPTGDPVSLTTTLIGQTVDSSVEVSFIPRYRRAW